MVKEIFFTQIAFIQLTGKSISVGSSEFLKVIRSSMKDQVDNLEYFLSGFDIVGNKIIVPYKSKNNESVAWLTLLLDEEDACLKELE